MIRINIFLVGVYLATAPDAEAIKLEAAMVKAWEIYVQLTEKRIEAELNSTSGFLRTDFLPPGRGVKDHQDHQQRARLHREDEHEDCRWP